MTDWIKKMKIKKSRYKTEMGITLLENMFITQYLPYVSENELKVYIYGLKFASEGYCHFEDFDNKKFAEILGLTQEEVEDAWNYWIDKKLVNRKNEDGNVYYEFNSLIDMFVSDFTDIENDEYVEGDLYDKNSFESGKYNKRFKDEILRVEEFIGTKLNYKELLEFKDYFSMYPDHDVELLPEAFKKSKRHNGGYIPKYITKILRDWYLKRILTLDDLKKSNMEEREIYKRKYTDKSDIVQRVLKASNCNSYDDDEKMNKILENKIWGNIGGDG